MLSLDSAVCIMPCWVNQTSNPENRFPTSDLPTQYTQNAASLKSLRCVSHEDGRQRWLFTTSHALIVGVYTFGWVSYNLHDHLHHPLEVGCFSAKNSQIVDPWSKATEWPHVSCYVNVSMSILTMHACITMSVCIFT